jgi:hypothetical protein
MNFSLSQSWQRPRPQSIAEKDDSGGDFSSYVLTFKGQFDSPELIINFRKRSQQQAFNPR